MMAQQPVIKNTVKSHVCHVKWVLIECFSKISNESKQSLTSLIVLCFIDCVLITGFALALVFFDSVIFPVVFTE